MSKEYPMVEIKKEQIGNKTKSLAIRFWKKAISTFTIDFLDFQNGPETTASG
jgi:hypothetical protein